MNTDNSSEKAGLHPRNKHRSRYDFKQLINGCKELEVYVSLDKYRNETIDFKNPEAVKTLNKALLKHFYDITTWDIPANCLCPPVPGRADYIHYIANLIAYCNNGMIPKGKHIRILDIGVGAACIYPIIGNREYGWRFVGSDIDPIFISNAKQIVKSNNFPANAIECRLQTSPSTIFSGIIKTGEVFDISICNPPFHSSAEEAETGTRRKWNNLGYENETKTIRNFGGSKTELWCEGGEKGFVHRMIEQSAQIPTCCFWFSTIISKKSNLPLIYKTLRKVNSSNVRTIDMAQGQKISRIVAWTFLDNEQQKEWGVKRWNVK